MKDRLFIRGLGLVPKSTLSRCVGVAAHAHLPKFITAPSVRLFAKLYGVNVNEADLPLDGYRTVGEFFTRRLKDGARPVDRRPGLAVSPADGQILNSGRIESGCLIQAKGRRFTVSALLDDEERALAFESGSWVTVYLSPRDYHRVHHPVEGKLSLCRYVGGRLWPVNRAAVRNVDQLFCVNERVVTYVDSPLGLVATVMVGATSVGHITVAYDETLETNRSCAAGERHYVKPIRVARGSELGTFHLGSTAIVLFANPDVALEALDDGQPIKMGQTLARIKSRRMRK